MYSEQRMRRCPESAMDKGKDSNIWSWPGGIMLQEAVSVRRDFPKIKTGHNGYNLKSGLDDPLHLVCLIFFPFLIFFFV